MVAACPELVVIAGRSRPFSNGFVCTSLLSDAGSFFSPQLLLTNAYGSTILLIGM